MSALEQVPVHLENEFGDSRTLVLLVTPGAAHERVVQEALAIANESPPQNWPAGVPVGTWALREES